MSILHARRSWMRGTAILLTAVASALASASASAVESVGSPFASGGAIRVIQGPNGGTHQGRSQSALDVVLAGGGTSGAGVVAPIAGVIAWAQAPGSGNGCLAIAMRDGSYSVALCHVVFERGFARGEGITRGQVLGTVGPPGSVGNNGTAHIHIELHRGSGANSPVLFGGPNGLPLEGVDVPAPAAPAAPTPAPARAAPQATPPPPRPQPAPAPLPTRTARDQSVASTISAPTRAAIVQGTDACLKIRTQPSLDSDVVDCVADGTEVRLSGQVIERDALTWREVPGQGWAAADFLRRTRAVVAGTGSCLNVRDVPSTLGAVLTCLPEGSTVAIGERTSADSGDWLRVDDGQGWVIAEFLD